MEIGRKEGKMILWSGREGGNWILWRGMEESNWILAGQVRRKLDFIEGYGEE